MPDVGPPGLAVEQLEWSVPRPLFRIPNFGPGLTVSADGQRFIAVVRAAGRVEPERLATLLNWTVLLK